MQSVTDIFINGSCHWILPELNKQD